MILNKNGGKKMNQVVMENPLGIIGDAVEEVNQSFDEVFNDLSGESYVAEESEEAEPDEPDAQELIDED